MSLQEPGLIELMFKLMDRGLRANEIGAAMNKMVGPGWREVQPAMWLERLKNNKYLPEDYAELSADVLELLIMGRNTDGSTRRGRALERAIAKTWLDDKKVDVTL